MSKPQKQPRRAKQSPAKLDPSKWIHAPKPDTGIIKWMDRFRKRYAAAHKALGKSVVELVREDREHGHYVPPEVSGMSKEKKLPDRVNEPRVVYRVLRTVKDRRAMKEAFERMEEIRKRHPRRPGEKDIVTLLREDREERDR